jgi:hypothetical protein
VRCPLCSTRAAKRACPALGREICPVCCATKRGTEIACPPGCGYLAAARAHPAAVIQRQHERDLAFLTPRVGALTETQYRLFLFAQAIVLQQTKDAMPAPLDVDVADAAATVAATLETARKGIIYEHQAAAVPAQRLATELTRVVQDLVQRAGADAARLERDAALALRGLERVARDAQNDAPDEARPDRSWFNLATRLMAPASAPGPVPAAPDPEPPRKLVI